MAPIRRFSAARAEHLGPSSFVCSCRARPARARLLLLPVCVTHSHFSLAQKSPAHARRLRLLLLNCGPRFLCLQEVELDQEPLASVEQERNLIWHEMRFPLFLLRPSSCGAKFATLSRNRLFILSNFLFFFFFFFLVFLLTCDKIFAPTKRRGAEKEKRKLVACACPLNGACHSQANAVKAPKGRRSLGARQINQKVAQIARSNGSSRRSGGSAGPN